MVAQTRRLDYERIKAEAAARRRSISRSGRDIGSIPPVADWKLRRECDRSLRVFAESLFPARFPLAWSDDHIRVLELTQNTIETGGRVSIAMPRGNGKTTIAEVGALWALVTARHRFGMTIGSTGPDGDAILESIKAELSTNELLASIYPAVCYPIHALEGEARRAKGQLHHGHRTHVVWGEDEIRLPCIPGEPASGAVIQTAGIEGHIRGRKVTLLNGEQVRPTLAILDDLQTEESAWSETQCEKRRRTVEGAVSGLAGPGKSVAMIFPCTVIRRGDLADTLLDRQQNPQWRGIRTKLIYDFPTNEKLWTEYAELRERSLREREDISLATEFYRKNRAAMDAGAKVAWPERYDREREISAVQHAMNLKLQDESAFWAEYQNEPLDDSAGDEIQLKPELIVSRTNGLERRQIPENADLLTAMIDVQGKVLYYLVAAWGSDFNPAAIVDYGTFPDQRKRYFTLREAKRTLARFKPGAGQEAQILAGIEELTADLCGRDWMREDGSPMRLDLCLIDANWGASTEVVYQACRSSPHAGQLMPSHGRFYGASSKPIGDRKKQRGERQGLNWFIPAGKGGKVRSVVFDANFWKTFSAARLAIAKGDPGGLTLFGSDPSEHRMLAEHLTSEQRIQTEGRGRRVDEWKLKRPGIDNHLLDCLVGSAVAASIRGAGLAEQLQETTRKRRRVKFSAAGA